MYIEDLLQKKDGKIIIKFEMLIKKCLICLIAVLMTSAQCFAVDVSKLYRIKNSTPEEIEKVLKPYLNRKFPNATMQENGYIIENKEYYHIIIIKTKDEDCYFYYMSNNEDESLRKNIIETLKNNDLKPKTVRNSNLKSFFYGEAYTNLAHSNTNTYLRAPSAQPQMPAEQIINAQNIEYDFSDEAQAKFNSQEFTPPQNYVKLNSPEQNYYQEPPITLPPITQNQDGIRLPKIESSNTLYQTAYNDYTPQNNQPLTGSVVYISEGTTISAALLSDISSDSLANNDNITAELDADWIHNGQLIAPSGSILTGRATETEAASFAMKNGRIGLLFDEIMTPDGNIIPLKTNMVYIVGNSSRALNVTKRIVGGAAVGLLISAAYLLAGMDPTGAIITGVSIGAGTGAISAITSKGEEIRVIEGTQLEIMLTEPLTVQIYRQ